MGPNASYFNVIICIAHDALGSNILYKYIMPDKVQDEDLFRQCQD